LALAIACDDVRLARKSAKENRRGKFSRAGGISSQG